MQIIDEARKYFLEIDPQPLTLQPRDEGHDIRRNAAITLPETDMRSIISFQARSCLRGAANWKYAVPCKALRWSSTEARQWSTPLAKQLSEAITV